MLHRYLLATFLLCTFSTGLQAEPIAPGKPIPELAIADRGELILNNDDIVYQPWSSTANPKKVHILQYMAATRSASKVYSKFTDALPEAFAETEYHVTTVLNLDAATWGTSGFVVSEVESNKREFPEATLVIDADGDGLKTWGLPKKGAALAIMDKHGTVLYFTQQAMTDGSLEQMLAVVKSQIDS